MSEGREPQGKRARAKRPARSSGRAPAPRRQSAGRSEPMSGPPTPPASDPATQHTLAPTYSAPFPIVAIGASAGGLSAFERFFSALPVDDDLGMAFVVIQHLSPDHKSALVDLVRRFTRMEVFEAENGLRVRPHCTYVIPPNHHLKLADGTLYLERQDGGQKPQLTIDHFFQSLAQAQKDRAICVVMSGTGTDGTLGLRAIKGEGGLVIVQAPDTTEYDGMPRSAIATGLVDYVLAPADMPAQLIAYAKHAFDPARKRHPPAREELLNKLCVLLRAQTGHDFSLYKETTLVRRIERRMALHQIVNVEDYIAFAREHAEELDALFRDLLIGVTEFFRDPEAFNVLDTRAIPQILEGKSAYDPVRVWVCGCATGEEAYSIAMLLYEHMMNSKQALKLQIFATDIDRLAIEHARTAIYPASIAQSISPDRLARFFVHDASAGTYRIQKYMRDLLVFSEQDVIRDPPFSRLDLISCRNLLIYLSAELQRKLIALFHYALVPGGVLFLGASETVGEGAPRFQVVDRRWKLYSRLLADKNRAPALPDFVPPLYDTGERRIPHSAGDAGNDQGSLRQVAERALLAHYAEAGVLVNGRGDILHIVGRTGKYLEPADGDASMNILSMAREGLRREITIGLHNVVAKRQMIAYSGLNVKANGEYIRANLTLRPVEAGGSVMYLVILEQAPERPAHTASASEEPQSERVAELERELRAKDEYLQSTLEEMETTNEELKSTNEEMQSINEELQSTNEELETSKEELQSVNEELSTVNVELQDKVAELSRANNDMNNLLAGTGVATVFVDHDLNIARFTPAATQVINLIPGDVGRPLEHVASNLIGYEGMIGDIQSVLKTLVPKEAEVQVKAGTWYLMRIRPYRTIENLIEGAVVTLVDISERKKAEALLRASETRLNVFINQADAGVLEADLEGQLMFVNDRFCRMLGYPREELLRKRLSDLTDPGDLPEVRARLDALIRGGPHARLDKGYVRADGSRLQVAERVSVIRDESGKPTSMLLLAFEDGEDALDRV